MKEQGKRNSKGKERKQNGDIAPPTQDEGEDKTGAVALTPDVRLDGELVVGQALGRRPLDGELGPGVGCVGVPCHQPAQAKISHLHQVVFPYQAVSGSKISGKGNSLSVSSWLAVSFTNLVPLLTKGQHPQWENGDPK